MQQSTPGYLKNLPVGSDPRGKTDFNARRELELLYGASATKARPKTDMAMLADPHHRKNTSAKGEKKPSNVGNVPSSSASKADQTGSTSESQPLTMSSESREFEHEAFKSILTVLSRGPQSAAQVEEVSLITRTRPPSALVIASP